MVLGNDFYRKMIFEYFYIFIFASPCQQSLFNFKSGLILMVQYPELRMAAFFGEIVFSGCVFIKIYAQFYQFFNSFRCFGNGNPHCFFIVQVVPGNKRVLNVFFVSIRSVHYSSNTALGVFSGSFFGLGFGNNTNFTKLRCFQSETKSGDTCSNNKEINIFSHQILSFSEWQRYKFKFQVGQSLYCWQQAKLFL